MRWITLVAVVVGSLSSHRIIHAAQAPDDPPLPPLSIKLKGDQPTATTEYKLTADDRKMIAAMKKRNAADLRRNRFSRNASGIQWKPRRTFQGKGDSGRMGVRFFANRQYRFRLYADGINGADAIAKVYSADGEVVAAIPNVPAAEEVQSAKNRASAAAPLTIVGTRAPRSRMRRLTSGFGSARPRALTETEKAAWGLVKDLEILQEGAPFTAKPGVYEIGVEANATWLLALEHTSLRKAGGASTNARGHGSRRRGSSGRGSVRQNRRSMRGAPGR